MCKHFLIGFIYINIFVKGEPSKLDFKPFMKFDLDPTTLPISKFYPNPLLLINTKMDQI